MWVAYTTALWQVSSVGSGRWCLILWVTEFLDCTHHHNILMNTTFRKLDLFPYSGRKGVEAPTLLDLLDTPNVKYWTSDLE
jgi:hypothetical protein